MYREKLFVGYFRVEHDKACVIDASLLVLFTRYYLTALSHQIPIICYNLDWIYPEIRNPKISIDQSSYIIMVEFRMIISNQLYILYGLYVYFYKGVAPLYIIDLLYRFLKLY